jgi:hypothetical protein
MNAITVGRRRVDKDDVNLEAHAKTAAAVGDLTRLLDEIAPRVLGVRTYQLDANGMATDNVRVPYKALAVSHVPVGAATSANATGTVNAPGAGATIAQVPLGVGTYTVSWEVELSGTLAAADANNFLLFQSGTGSNFTVINSENLAVAGSYAQLSVTVTSTNTNNFIKILTNVASTAGSVYTGSLAVQQVISPVMPPLFVSNNPAQSQMPTSGPGVAVLRWGGMIAVNLTGRSFTVSGGNTGDLVTVTMFGTHVPPVSS